MTFQLKRAVGALVCVAAMSAQAADWYVGGSVGQSDFKEDLNSVQGALSIDKKDTGYKLFFGAGLTQNLAVEGGYANFGKLKAQATLAAKAAQAASSGSTNDFGVKAEGYFVDIVGRLPLSTEFALLGKVGVFNGHAKTYGISALGVAVGDSTLVDRSDSGTDVKYGLGVSYAVNKTIGIRAEWERFRFKALDEKSDVDLLSVGVNFSF